MPTAATSDGMSGAGGAGGGASERRATDRRATSRRSSQAVLRQIVQHLPDGIVIVDAEGSIRFANPAAERLFGRPAAELVGQEFGYPLASEEAAEIEIVHRTQGLVVAELRTVESVWEDEPATLVSLRDVTDRKHAEDQERQLERARAARAEAEAANQAKSEFLAVMSHELRTPLNAVLGYAELLDLGVVGALSNDQRQQVGRITAAGQHLLGLVNEILDYAKVEAGRLTVARIATSAGDVVDAAVVLAQPQAEARGLVIDIGAGVRRDLAFIGDHDRVLQILANLLSNAVKFTGHGGSIRIDVEESSAPASRHLHGASRWIVIRVIDTGIGIAAEQLDDVFTAFVQGQGGHTRERDGTGLGLTISRRIARLMGGEVLVESEIGKGSTFALWLPAAPGTAAVAGSRATPEREPEVRATPRTRGLAAFGDAMLHEGEAILDAFIAQMRRDEGTAAAAELGSAQIADHVGTMIADIAAALVALDESEGTLSALLHDTADIQRFIADRHGLQRARLAWTPAMLTRETAILMEEIERGVRRCVTHPPESAIYGEAMAVIRRYVDQAGEISCRALQRAGRHARRGTP
jgi:signal transduction histidine kinase